jgi:hypothetical protein
MTICPCLGQPSEGNDLLGGSSYHLESRSLPPSDIPTAEDFISCCDERSELSQDTMTRILRCLKRDWQCWSRSAHPKPKYAGRFRSYLHVQDFSLQLLTSNGKGLLYCVSSVMQRLTGYEFLVFRVLQSAMTVTDAAE